MRLMITGKERKKGWLTPIQGGCGRQDSLNTSADFRKRKIVTGSQYEGLREMGKALPCIRKMGEKILAQLGIEPRSPPLCLWIGRSYIGEVIPLDHCALLVYQTVAHVHVPALRYCWETVWRVPVSRNNYPLRDPHSPQRGVTRYTYVVEGAFRRPCGDYTQLHMGSTVCGKIKLGLGPNPRPTGINKTVLPWGRKKYCLSWELNPDHLPSACNQQDLHGRSHIIRPLCLFDAPNRTPCSCTNFPQFPGGRHLVWRVPTSRNKYPFRHSPSPQGNSRCSSRGQCPPGHYTRGESQE